MNNDSLKLEVLNNYKLTNDGKFKKELEQLIDNNPNKIIVLDDDPTGTQTVHDIYVYTNWNKESLKEAFLSKEKVFYILTNSRSLTSNDTKKLHEEIMENIISVSKEVNIPFTMISRSDSTLRGHYPLETDIIYHELYKNDIKLDGEILCFFFKEGGRYTIDKIHYVKEGNLLKPASTTEFAKDSVFGYSSSDLTYYIEEKTKGKIKHEDVKHISIEMLVNKKIDEIESILLECKDFEKIVVDATEYSHLEVFALAFYRALEKGKKFLFRSAASIVRVLGGIKERELLHKDDMVKISSSNGGLIVVGSYTNKTTAQLNELLKLDSVESVELKVKNLLKDENSYREEVENCLSKIEKIIKSGLNAACYTSRELINYEDDTEESFLNRSQLISNAVKTMVSDLNINPAFVISKGGITSSDVATKALKINKGLVLGQIQPGIPVWQTEKNSRFSNIPFVIFPGNTGDENTLRISVEILDDK